MRGQEQEEEREYVGLGTSLENCFVLYTTPWAYAAFRETGGGGGGGGGVEFF